MNNENQDFLNDLINKLERKIEKNKKLSLSDGYKHISISAKQTIDMTGIDGGNIVRKAAANFVS